MEFPYELEIRSGFKDTYDINKFIPIAEGNFGCVMKVGLVNSNKFIALKIQLPTEKIKDAAQEAKLTFEISNTRDPDNKNPFIPLVFDKYFIAPSDNIYKTIIKILKDDPEKKCKKFTKLLEDQIGDVNFQWEELEETEKIEEKDKWTYYEGIIDRSELLIIELEFIENGNLTDFTHNKKKLTRKTVKPILFQLIWGLYSLQREFNLIHRDLKAPNILYQTIKTKKNLSIRLNDENLFRITINEKTPRIFISDFGTSLKYKNRTEGEIKDWQTGTLAYSSPMLLILGPIDQNEISPKSFPERGPDSDIWTLGNLMVAMILHDWEMPKNVLGIEKFQFETITDLFFFESEKKSHKVVEEISEKIIDWTNDPDVSKFISWNVKEERITVQLVSRLLATCQFQKFMGWGFLPDKDDRSLRNTCYSLGLIAQIISDNEEKILKTGESFIVDDRFKGENIFELAANEIRKRVGDIGFDFIKRHLGWMPKQRRKSEFDIAENGAFLYDSINDPFFEDLRVVKIQKGDEKYGYDDDPPKPKEYEPFILGKSLDPKQEFYISESLSTTNQSVKIISRFTRLPFCNHEIQKNKLITWLVENKKKEQSICPICEFINKQTNK